MADYNFPLELVKYMVSLVGTINYFRGKTCNAKKKAAANIFTEKYFI